jgi:hypothetical protein
MTANAKFAAHQLLACSFAALYKREIKVDMCVYSGIIDANFASKQAKPASKIRKRTFCVEIPTVPWIVCQKD